MIVLDDLTFAYAASDRRVLDGVTVTIDAGELVLVVGPSGGGKSTLLRCMNGLVPHFHGGSFAGRIVVGGLDTRDHQPRDMATTVGMVFQDPESQVVASTVEDEIAFGMENVGLPREAMRKRVEETLDLLRIAPLRQRRLDTLSGGELQRVAIASVLTMQPRALLLDEPTSQLDPQAAEELLTTVQRLNDDLGLTVLIAEHRLERVVQYAGRVLYVPGDGTVHSLDVREAMATLPLAPPVSRVGRALGWSPVPLSVREGRRFVDGASLPKRAPRNGTHAARDIAISLRDVDVAYDGIAALRGVTLDVCAGEIVALMGRNGAGKSTLLRALVGLRRPERGDVFVLGTDIIECQTEELACDVAFVPQAPTAVLHHQTVEAEIADVLASARRAGSVDEALTRWGLQRQRASHPADLSAGERQRAAIAAMLAGRPRVVLLDEPTRGMDYETKETLVRELRQRANDGAAIVVASHDVELAGRLADRVVLLSDGEVFADGAARDVLSETLTFSTQINKLFGGAFLTPEDVIEAPT